jgi:hypothetical protein
MRAAGILRLIAADHKKFRNHMIEHMQRRTHMGTHDICAQRCPPFQRFAPALARSLGRPTRLLARHAARIDGGDHSPHHPDATTRNRQHKQKHRCAQASENADVAYRHPRIASGGGIPRPWAAHSTPPAPGALDPSLSGTDRAPGPCIFTRGPPRAPVPPT